MNTPVPEEPEKMGLKIPKEELENFLVPFRYKNNLIYATEIILGDVGYIGLYGFGKNKIFFEPYDALPDILEVEVPSTVEGLQEFLVAIEYIIQKLSLNGLHTHLESIDRQVNQKELIKPYVDFIKNYEINMSDIERMKR